MVNTYTWYFLFSNDVSQIHDCLMSFTMYFDIAISRHIQNHYYHQLSINKITFPMFGYFIKQGTYFRAVIRDLSTMCSICPWHQINAFSLKHLIELFNQYRQHCIQSPEIKLERFHSDLYCYTFSSICKWTVCILSPCNLHLDYLHPDIYLITLYCCTCLGQQRA